MIFRFSLTSFILHLEFWFQYLLHCVNHFLTSNWYWLWIFANVLILIGKLHNLNDASDMSCFVPFSNAQTKLKHISRVFLQRQLWIVNYYMKRISNNFSDEKIKTGVSREIHISKISSFWHFNSRFVLN